MLLLTRNHSHSLQGSMALNIPLAALTKCTDGDGRKALTASSQKHPMKGGKASNAIFATSLVTSKGIVGSILHLRNKVLVQQRKRRSPLIVKF